MKKKMFKPLLLLTVLLLTLNSCIGVSADIQMNRDGSGRITMEYRFSRMAEIIGRLDGNERWQTIPVSHADFERTAARIPGMKLISFSSREQDSDIVNNVTLEFKDPEALLAFFDPAGSRAVLSRSNGSNRLDIILHKNTPSPVNADLLDLMRQTSAGYKVRMSFSAEGNSTMALTDGEGKAIAPPPEVQAVLSGKKVSLEIGTGDILSRKDGLGLRVNWN